MVAETERHTPEGIVWLASYPKSGNTWTRAFLHNLLNVMKGEGSGAQDINRMTEYTVWDISGEAFRKALGKAPDAASRDEVAAARPKVQATIADEAGGLMFVKTHNALVMDRGHPTINLGVTSGVVYIVRNPLDVAISFSHHMGATLDEAIERMGIKGYETSGSKRSAFEIYGSWSENVFSWTRRPNRALYIMRYEDMHNEPTKTFGALARHLLINPNQAQLKHAIELSSFKEMQHQEEEAGYREKPKTADKFFRKGEVGEWKEVLSGAQVERIRKVHGEQMRRFGYLD